jgi:hypothetical protein
MLQSNACNESGHVEHGFSRESFDFNRESAMLLRSIPLGFAKISAAACCFLVQVQNRAFTFMP